MCQTVINSFTHPRQLASEKQPQCAHRPCGSDYCPALEFLFLQSKHFRLQLNRDGSPTSSRKSAPLLANSSASMTFAGKKGRFLELREENGRITRQLSYERDELLMAAALPFPAGRFLARC